MEGYIFDYRLGYVRDCRPLVGFDIYGEDSARSRRIVALGGYTTPDMAQNGRSWAEHLYRQLGGKFQIMNGCTDGYSSAQILTMFIREVILLRPKLVICLTGYCNTAYKLGLVENKAVAEFLKTHPFATPGQMEFLRKIVSRFQFGNNEIYYGEENVLSAAEYWFMQMKILRCLCDEFNIKLISFLQPCAFSGRYERSERENSKLRERYGISNDEINRFHDEFQNTYKDMIDISKGMDCIADISNLFDNAADVYLDACHVKDEYIPEITGAIYLRIKSEGFDI